MTVSIPTVYSLTDLTVGEGIAHNPGRPSDYCSKS